MESLIVFGAKYLIALPALVFAVYVLLVPSEARLKLITTLALALPLVYALARLAGFLYGHEQPFSVYGFEPLVPHEVDNSFPSDHVAVAGVFAGVLWKYQKLLSLSLFASALLIGLARMAAGLHYASDVLVAAALAIGALWLTQGIISVIYTEVE